MSLHFYCHRVDEAGAGLQPPEKPRAPALVAYPADHLCKYQHEQHFREVLQATDDLFIVSRQTVEHETDEVNFDVALSLIGRCLGTLVTLKVYGGHERLVYGITLQMLEHMPEVLQRGRCVVFLLPSSPVVVSGAGQLGEGRHRIPFDLPCLRLPLHVDLHRKLDCPPGAPIDVLRDLGLVHIDIPIVVLPRVFTCDEAITLRRRITLQGAEETRSLRLQHLGPRWHSGADGIRSGTG
mmetsp:Transcript_40382/g.111289  ORF Transcript_40382/g.111289 Transcript_40382/m.111289 type:complete len:238 (+) Transcript_40382:270-983(+)